MKMNLIAGLFKVWSWDKVVECGQCKEFVVVRNEVAVCDLGHTLHEDGE
jgi:hypothetical protein